MKRILLPLMMLVCLSSLLGRPTLVVSSEGEGPAYALLESIVERVGSRSLLTRTDGEGELSVFIDALQVEEANALSANLLFSYGERTLTLCLSAQAKDARHLEKELEERLSSMLLYDGLSLFEATDVLVVDYTYYSGYAALAPLRKGERYKGLDAQGNRWATAVVQHTFTEPSPVSLLVATGGKALLPGMRLEALKGRALQISLFSSLSSLPGFGLEGTYSQDIGLYPFTLVLGGGLDFKGKPLAIASLYGRAGFAVTLPLSMVFSLNGGFWRNSALMMECTVGLGYAPFDNSMVFGSTALFSYRYHLGSYSLNLGLGNRHWASKGGPFSSGLFMQLGLAYTW